MIYRYLLILVFILSLLDLAAQKKGGDHGFDQRTEERMARASFSRIHLPAGDLPDEVIRYLNRSNEQFTSSFSQPVLLRDVKSPVGRHLTFEQHYQGIPVFNSQVKVNLDKEGAVISQFDNSYFSGNWEFYPLEIQRQKLANTSLGQLLPAMTISQDMEIGQRPVIYYHEKDEFPEVMLEVELLDASRGIHRRMVVDLNSRIHIDQDLRSFFRTGRTDSLVSAYVFLPNPVTTANTVYGGNYRNFDNADVPELNAERKEVKMRVAFENGKFFLENDVLKITHLQGPQTFPASQTIPEFRFTRGEHEFEQVNAYYHLTAYNDYLKHLGFSNLPGFQVRVDPWGTTAENSYFLASNPPQLIFGLGGVNDAEDADVIIHEYGHAISFGAAPFTNQGFERQALDEGFGDYLAASYSRQLDGFHWWRVFNWDGHNEFWPGRIANKTGVYPDALGANIYSAGELWSSTLMEGWELIGSEIMDKLVIQSMYSYATNISMSDAAKLILQADVMIYHGIHSEVLKEIFINRRFIDDIWPYPENTIAGTTFFVKGMNSATFYLSQEATHAQVEVFDIQGKKLTAFSTENKIIIIPFEWFTAPGMYFIRVTTPEEIFTEKIIYSGVGGY